MSASRNAYSHLANGGERVSVQNGDWYARAEIILTSKGGLIKYFLVVLNVWRLYLEFEQ